jgi:hypothetical protein
MATLIIRYRLQEGVTPADFEAWVQSTDHPTMRGLRRVRSFETYRVSGLLIGEGQPSSDYVEIFEIDDLAGFTGEDMPGPAVQGVMGGFMGFVDAPEFLICDAIDPA